MMEHDPLIASALDRLVPTSRRRGDWEAVVHAARPAGLRFKGRRRTVVLAFAVIAIAVPVAVSSTIYFRDFPAPSDVPPGVEPVREGEKHVLTSGKVSGVFWRLVTYRSTEGLCLDVDLAGGVSASGGGCGFAPFRSAIEVPVSHYYLAQVDRTWLVGRVSNEAASVTLVLADNQKVEARTYSSPPTLGLRHGFYLAVVAGDLTGSLDSPSVIEAIATDASGQEIARATANGALP